MLRNNPWLPIAYRLAEGVATRRLAHSGDDWQIYATDPPGYVLVAQGPLERRWVDCGFLDGRALVDIAFGDMVYKMLRSPRGLPLEPVAMGKSLVGHF